MGIVFVWVGRGVGVVGLLVCWFARCIRKGEVVSQVSSRNLYEVGLLRVKN